MKTISDYKVNFKSVMVRAWSLVKSLGYSLSEAMKKAWHKEKVRRISVFSDLSISDKKLINKGREAKTIICKMNADALNNFYNNSTSGKTYFGD